jgi:omega-hydroxy-beta-dihydromenaquinone-9 sulfotransferase
MYDLRQLIPFFPLVNFIGSLYRYGFPRILKAPLFAIWFLKLIVLEPFRWMGEWRWLLTKNNNPDDPVFVLGLYRSGTTYLQQLLSRDPDMATVTLFHSVLPELLGLREVFAPVFRLIVGIGKFENRYHRLPLRWDFPGEDDVAINASGCSGDFNKMFQHPSSIDKILSEYIDFTDAEKKRKWISEHTRLVKRLAAVNPGKRLVLKSPPHTGRITLLKSIYPKAKFIFIHRSPSEVIPSMRRVWNLNKPFCFESYTMPMADSFSIKLYSKLHRKYFEEKLTLSVEDLAEVSYDDFVNHTEEELKKIYRKLELPGIDNSLGYFKSLIDERKDYLHFSNPQR